MWAKRDGCRKNQKKYIIILEPKNERKKEGKKETVAKTRNCER